MAHPAALSARTLVPLTTSRVALSKSSRNERSSQKIARFPGQSLQQNRAKLCAISSEIPEPEQLVFEPENSDIVDAAAARDAQLPSDSAVEKTSSSDSSSSDAGFFLSPAEAEEVIGNVKDSSFFTLPGELTRGEPFTMFVDVNKSDALKNCSNVKVSSITPFIVFISDPMNLLAPTFEGAKESNGFCP